MKPHDEAGSALVSALLLIFLVAAMANVMFIRTSTVARDTLRERGEMQAGYAAAAGLAKARVALRQDPDWVGCALRVGRCEVVVTVQVLAPRRWRVSSRAVAWPGGRRGVRVKGSRSTVIDPAR